MSIYHNKKFITEEAIQKSATKKCPKNSILVVTRVGVGKVALATEEIELLQTQLEQEKQRKASLMQLLLTGIVRV